jgi:hypothetical protein
MCLINQIFFGVNLSINITFINLLMVDVFLSPCGQSDLCSLRLNNELTNFVMACC